MEPDYWGGQAHPVKLLGGGGSAPSSPRSYSTATTESYAKLAPRWALIRINFDPIQGIGGWALYREWALFARSRVSHGGHKINSLFPDWVSVSLLHMLVYMYVSRPLLMSKCCRFCTSVSALQHFPLAPSLYTTSPVPYLTTTSLRAVAHARHPDAGNMLRWLQTV